MRWRDGEDLRREPLEARGARPAAQRAHRGGRSHRVRPRLQNGPGGHRLEAQGLAVPLRPLAGLAQEQEPGCAAVKREGR